MTTDEKCGLTRGWFQDDGEFIGELLFFDYIALPCRPREATVSGDAG